MKKLLIATIPNMIEKQDTKALSKVCTKELLQVDSVILSPANAWNSDESMANLKNIWINNILEFEKGNIVNLVTK